MGCGTVPLRADEGGSGNGPASRVWKGEVKAFGPIDLDGAFAAIPFPGMAFFMVRRSFNQEAMKAGISRAKTAVKPAL
jgi:hypothetical protein